MGLGDLLFQFKDPISGAATKILEEGGKQIDEHNQGVYGQHVADVNEKNAQLQREFAQHGIRWRVEDARAAGLHPLAALGMQPASASPSFVSAPFVEGTDYGRAARAGMTGGERLGLLSEMLSIQRMGLENELLASQIARMKMDGPPGPEIELKGQYEPQPHMPVVPQRGLEGVDPGVINDVSYVLAPDGMSVSLAPSKDVKERLEDNPLLEALWMIRNLGGAALFGARIPEPTFPPPKGHFWQRTRTGFRAVKSTPGVRG